jgi:hypothetical protein
VAGNWVTLDALSNGYYSKTYIDANYFTNVYINGNFVPNYILETFYYTAGDVDDLFLLITDAVATYLTIATAATTYLTVVAAAATYLTIATAASTYLTIVTAASTYLTISAAAATYLTISTANSTYYKIADFNRYLPSLVGYNLTPVTTPFSGTVLITFGFAKTICTVQFNNITFTATSTNRIVVNIDTYLANFIPYGDITGFYNLYINSTATHVVGKWAIAKILVSGVFKWCLILYADIQAASFTNTFQYTLANATCVYQSAL